MHGSLKGKQIKVVQTLIESVNATLVLKFWSLFKFRPWVFTLYTFLDFVVNYQTSPKMSLTFFKKQTKNSHSSAKNIKRHYLKFYFRNKEIIAKNYVRK